MERIFSGAWKDKRGKTQTENEETEQDHKDGDEENEEVLIVLEILMLSYIILQIFFCLNSSSKFLNNLHTTYKLLTSLYTFIYSKSLRVYYRNLPDLRILITEKAQWNGRVLQMGSN